MAKTKQKKETSAKKDLRNKLTTVLADGFPEIKSAVGKKKFKKNVQKATKVLTIGITSKKKDKKVNKVKAGKKTKLRSLTMESAVEPTPPNISTAGELEIAAPAK